ncbi:uncharacterized protein LOC124114193 [Haliotis rufescens]|uniref:uncharacterized protein LOC124114193 n=1 Tax=Haliotis rufescens TaxID=6454 RepID=UPI00201F82F2|nr:uncharacterized protein LOC124114193 [Haliotis rufescens]
MKSMFVSRLNSPTTSVTHPSPLVSLGFVETPLSDLASACSHCTQTFSAVASKTFLKTNNTTVLSSLDSRFYWCNFCHFSGDSKDAIVDHVVKQHRFGCKWCSFQSFCRASVLRHSLQKHQHQMKTAVNMSALCSFVEDRCSICIQRQPSTSNHGNTDSQTSALIPRDVQDTTLLKALLLATPAEELDNIEETDKAVKSAQELKDFIDQVQMYNTDPVFVETSSSSKSLVSSFGGGKPEDHIGRELYHQNTLKPDSRDMKVLSVRCDDAKHDTTAEMKTYDETVDLARMRKPKISIETQCRIYDPMNADHLEPVSRTLIKDQNFKDNLNVAGNKEISLPLTKDDTETPTELKGVTVSISPIKHDSHHTNEKSSCIIKPVGKLHKSGNKGKENVDSNFCPPVLPDTEAVKESPYIVLNFPDVAEQLLCTNEGGVPITKQAEGLSVALFPEAQPMECLRDTVCPLIDRVSVKEPQPGRAYLGTESRKIPSPDDHADDVRTTGSFAVAGSSVTNIKMKITKTVADNNGSFTNYLKGNTQRCHKDHVTLYPEVPFYPIERSSRSGISSAASQSLDLEHKPQKLEEDSLIPAGQCREGKEAKSLPSVGSKKAATIDDTTSIEPNHSPGIIAQLLQSPSVKQYDANMPQGPGQIQEIALSESEAKRSRLSSNDHQFQKMLMKDVSLGLIKKQTSEMIIKALEDQERSVATASEQSEDLETGQIMSHLQTQCEQSESKMRTTLLRPRYLPELTPESTHATHKDTGGPTTGHSKTLISTDTNLLINNSRGSVQLGMACFDQVSTGSTFCQHSRSLGEVVKRLHRRCRETDKKAASYCKEVLPISKKRKIMKKK